jgi:hypothetical protein
MVATVFPTPAVMQTGSPATAYTFAPGSYEYPFSFKVSYLAFYVYIHMAWGIF